VGFDPSADSLTIGNLLAMSLVIRGARAGLDAVVLLGGATGLIGDPSGKSAERSLLPVEEARKNVARHRDLMTSIFARALTPDQMPEFVDNLDWLGGIGAIDFLRDVGKHFPMGEMIRRESVRRRINDANDGMSFTEFSYALLQAYDFMRLCADRDVTLQMGASDQWGNIVAGIDYIRRTLRRPAYAITCPLLLRADGTKFGKTEKGAIWISADRTSPYELYQFMVNLSDDEARKFALFFSLESRDYLENLFEEHSQAPAKRALQRHLAREITTLLHGDAACEEAEAASQALFSGNVRAIAPAMLDEIFASTPSITMERTRLAGDGLDIVDLLVATELATSNRRAREFLSGRAVIVNGDPVDAETRLTDADLLDGSLLLVRRGKREWRVVRFT
jgi:tyrosyl-tRNA synthetase